MRSESRGPRERTRVAGKWPALALAIAVHVVFIAVLVFSIRWQSRKPEPVTAELYAPPVKAVEPPRPQPTPPPVVPPPEPKAEPIPEPPKPAPPVEKPDTRAAEIALKARQEEDRRLREQAEAERREAEKKRLDEQRRLAEAEQRRLAESRERQTREAQALKAQAEREAQVRSQRQTERDAMVRAEQQAVRDAQDRARQQDVANARAMEDYIRRIQAKVRGNVILPGDIAGNPETVFEVVQLPTGEIIDVKLRKSSGLPAYDDAVERAIHKSSPLPRPAQPDLWQRVLTLQFRPRE